MIYVFRRRLATALVASFIVYFCSGGLLAASPRAQSTEASAQNDTSTKDRAQWRKLQRHMTKDEVRKLLGEPDRVSVSRFFESWYYSGGNLNFSGGSVTFDGKGRVDFWSEP